ncbi:SAP domain-containing protein [Actomonas aquatica]|uniref:SAP domain-containing protein n=1 Tax=Actomonas aquatica TaxID=2866162 RepID=A0ABZ1CHF6_9BACT|nr:SAP domain-containing protein [Opitutus sp. WL0086]WRQ89700.1 SAP domain-containing protein [Opitutus sp. WL0086]
MNIAKAVEICSTSLILKRIASAYVIDYRNLTDDELKAALIKTAPQYYYPANLSVAINDVFHTGDRQHRILGRVILKEILLNQDGFISCEKETFESVVAYEQTIIDAANESLLQNAAARSDHLDLFKFVVETAWLQNADISVDEFNLIEKLRVRMKLTEREHRVVEASLNRFPKPNNELHTRTEVEETRRLLQSKGLLFSIRNEDGTDFDVVPDEIAGQLRQIFGIRLKRHGYDELLNYKAVRSKSYLTTVLQKSEIDLNKGLSLPNLQHLVQAHIRPEVLLGGLTPRDGLELETLKKWCAELSLMVSGSKAEIIERIIEFYDGLLVRTETEGDPRAIWYEHFEKLAARDLHFLRSQQLIEKDIECESHFEDATDFLFQKRLLHKPLKLIGSAHADGVLSFRDKVIVWDNKSKESPVHLKDHLRQFETYIRNSERPVAGFWVIGPDFTTESQSLAMQFTVDCGATITLVKACDLKHIAEAWAKRNEKKSEEPFPLGYLIQPGLMNPALIVIN